MNWKSEVHFNRIKQIKDWKSNFLIKFLEYCQTENQGSILEGNLYIVNFKTYWVMGSIWVVLKNVIAIVKT